MEENKSFSTIRLYYQVIKLVQPAYKFITKHIKWRCIDMDSTLLMPPPKQDIHHRIPSETPTDHQAFTPAATLTGAVGKQLPHISELPAQDTGFEPVPAPEPVNSKPAPETSDPPRAVRRSYRRRNGIPPMYTLTAVAGLIAGVLAAASLPAGADLSGNILFCSGSFLEILLKKLAWSGVFLLAEYICGFFALGRLLVWLVPLVCGLGTGAALGAAFLLNGADALWMVPGCAVCTAVIVFSAKTSAEMSAQLLRLVSTNKNSIVSTSPAAGEYTLRFLVSLAILSACAIAGAALRMSAISA